MTDLDVSSHEASIGQQRRPPFSPGKIPIRTLHPNTRHFHHVSSLLIVVPLGTFSNLFLSRVVNTEKHLKELLAGFSGQSRDHRIEFERSMLA